MTIIRTSKEIFAYEWFRSFCVCLSLSNKQISMKSCDKHFATPHKIQSHQITFFNASHSGLRHYGKIAQNTRVRQAEILFGRCSFFIFWAIIDGRCSRRAWWCMAMNEWSHNHGQSELDGPRNGDFSANDHYREEPEPASILISCRGFQYRSNQMHFKVAFVTVRWQSEVQESLEEVAEADEEEEEEKKNAWWLDSI